ncbi:hypothetical protein BDR03DRAFT_954835 [Suillus americanus]|nr:hypothetical protein BDR03DRAFT_954835 [Suillus americanus]
MWRGECDTTKACCICPFTSFTRMFGRAHRNPRQRHPGLDGIQTSYVRTLQQRVLHTRMNYKSSTIQEITPASHITTVMDIATKDDRLLTTIQEYSPG